MLGHAKPLEAMSNEYDAVVNRFTGLLGKFEKGPQLIIIIDALDQFTEFTKLEWIEERLPRNVKIIVSTLPGEYFNLLRYKVPPKNFKKIKKLKVSEGKKILNSWLEINSRRLQGFQYKEIISNFERKGLPLYLKIAFEESLHWHSYTKNIQLDKTLKGIIHGYIDRLIAREYHSKELVEHVLGYICASKNGLSENELYEILSNDEVVMQAILNRHHKITPVENVSKLPAAIWARFYADLLKHLSLTTKDNAILLNFYHRQIAKTIEKYYYTPDRHLYHAKLTEYFLTQPSLFSKGRGIVYNLRKNSELPYQLYKNEAFRLFAEHYDLDLLHIKSNRGHILQALLELHEAYNAIEASSLRKSLKSRLKEQLCETLIGYLLIRVKETDNVLLSVEAIHATNIYRDEKNFYDHLLKIASDRKRLHAVYLKYERTGMIKENTLLRYYVAFRARLSNKERRETKLGKAFKSYLELRKLIQDKGLKKKADYDELSKIEYDMGYICYLQGKFPQAIKYMDLSIKSCVDADKPVNRAISECLKYRIGFLSGTYTAEEFDEVLEKALKIFYRHRLENSSAKRWVRNVLAHQFEVAYSEKKLKRAKKLFTILKNDDWKREFKKENKFTNDLADKGRVLILEEKYSKAIKAFERYIFEYIGPLKKRQNREAVARDYYDYLLALKKKNKMKKFKKVLKELQENIPDKPGNELWKTRALELAKE
jgi:hypothetical protein